MFTWSWKEIHISQQQEKAEQKCQTNTAVNSQHANVLRRKLVCDLIKVSGF